MIITISSFSAHPIYVSVIDMEFNAREKQLEISCKIFTDDFEKTLRKRYNVHVDLLDAKYRPEMNKLVNDYIQKHFSVIVDSKAVVLKFIGYEQAEEGVNCYFEADNIYSVTSIKVSDNLLYEYQAQQMSLIHCTVNGDTKNFKLDNPDSQATFEF